MIEELITKIVEETVKITLAQLAISKRENENVIQTMNTKQVAEYLNMSVPWVYQNLSLLSPSKIGKKLIFNKKEIDKFLEQKKGKKDNKETQNKFTTTTKVNKVV